MPAPRATQVSGSSATSTGTSSFAISTDETRYVLNGILFSLKENKLTMVATDTHRLALRQGSVSQAEGEVAAIIPARSSAS